ncbi:hypothetical protein Ahy_A10g050528 [Arachis hypogaea]|uniref:RNase H type-1 domain-containing protein n=1 Tax=Arachis hypogaea TaxID=3818 RepID=A0A445B9K8_ARAHY|nr:hypothetical protein Ahy_A10g050528 [Arachis hypogaea]
MDNQACKRFADWINECSLIDLGFVGSKYTLRGPKWKGLERFFKCLDRALSNAEWRTRFLDDRVDIQTKTHSDHHPMMISLKPDILSNGHRPFSEEDQNPSLLNTEVSYPPLREELSRNMDSIPKVTEIRRAIFSIGSLKAHGIDGFPALFYKKNWNVIQKNDISKIWEKNRMHFSWWMNNGKLDNFFNDRWLGEGPLVLNANREINDEERRMTVAHFVDEKGEWNRMLLSNYVEGKTYQSILNTTPPKKKGENNKIYWSHTTNASNKFKRNEKLHLEDDLEVARVRTNQNICMTLSHVMRDCPRAVKIWAKLLQPSVTPVFFNLSFSDWITFNLENGLGKSSHMNGWISSLLLAGCYGSGKTWSSSLSHSKHKKWGRHLEKNQKIAVCGSLIRTNEGEWAAGFIANLGNCNVIHAELKGVSLRIGNSLGSTMIVEMDFKGVDFITKREEDEERYCYNPFLQEIRRIKNKHWELQFRHIRREANRVANAFAKFALSKAKGFPFFDNPPENLEQILYDNVKGMYTYPIYCLFSFLWAIKVN